MQVNYSIAVALIIGFASAAVAAQNQFFIVQDRGQELPHHREQAGRGGQADDPGR